MEFQPAPVPVSIQSDPKVVTYHEQVRQEDEEKKNQALRMTITGLYFGNMDFKEKQ